VPLVESGGGAVSLSNSCIILDSFIVLDAGIKRGAFKGEPLCFFFAEPAASFSKPPDPPPSERDTPPPFSKESCCEGGASLRFFFCWCGRGCRADTPGGCTSAGGTLGGGGVGWCGGDSEGVDAVYPAVSAYLRTYGAHALKEAQVWRRSLRGR
jgi:hypothetical protein